MNNELKIEQSVTNNLHSTVKFEKSGEEIYIPDECGDTLWDAVLEQQVGACKISEGTNNANALLNKLTEVQECDATEA
jgi:hypothetical protein